MAIRQIPVAALLVVGSVAACAGGSPVASLPPCTAPSPVAAQVDGLIAPDGTRLTMARAEPPVTQVTGWVEKTPVEVRSELVARPGITVIKDEDEGIEAELLLEADGYRTFIVAAQTCRTGSTLGMVVAPASAAAAVPTPRGTASGS